MSETDDTDRQIIDRLRDDPRMANKDLAADLGLAEATVSTRVKALRDAGIARVIAQLDVRKLGFDLVCLLDIEVAGRPARSVAEELSQIDEVSSVSLCGGSPAIIAQLNARDRNHLNTLLYEEIGAVAGVAGASCTLITRMYKFKSEWGTLK